jgi:hypothetical protein
MGMNVDSTTMALVAPATHSANKYGSQATRAAIYVYGYDRKRERKVSHM